MKLPDEECAQVVSSGWLTELEKLLFDGGPNLMIEDATVRMLIGALRYERKRVDAARVAARAFVARVEDLGAFADDTDPRVMANAGPLGAAQADLWIALGLNVDDEHARMLADIESRCAVCGWPLATSVEQGCVRGNCSMRPRPTKLYAPERAAREAGIERDR